MIAARVVEDVLDRRADLVVRHADHFVHRLLCEGERDAAHFADCNAVGEDADAIERDARPACSDRYIASASNGSTPMMRTSGISDRM